MSAVTTWQLDPAHTEVGFAVRHLMISTVRGRFTGVAATVTQEGEDPTTARIEASVQAASVYTGIEQRDAHLRSADFFDAERYPELRFVSRRIERAGEGFQVRGDLTIRDVTREVVLDVEPHGTIRDPWGGVRAAYSVSGRINRSDFGIKWNQLIEAGGVAVGDEVKLAIEVQLVQQGLPAAA
jgi:polyisoprenoid-binding protein YceI